MKDVKIKCNSIEEADAVLQMIEDRYPEVRWHSGNKPTEWKPYDSDTKDDAKIYFDVDHDCISYSISTDDWHKDCNWTNATSAKRFLRKSNTAIHIYQRGRMVIAHESQTGREAIAKCSPSDTFNFNTGASIALARLMAKTPDALNHDVKDEWIKALGLTPVEKRIYTDADREFKVGDRVVVRDWDDMEREFECRDGGIRKSGCCTSFIDSMRHLCGRTATVVRVYDADRVEVDFDNKSGNTDYFYRAWMFNPVDTPKFIVGYHVIIRQWDDMKETGRQDNAGNIFDTHHKGCFSTAMKSICGKEVEIIESDPSDNDRFKISAVINGYTKKWWVRTWMIERLVQKPTPSFKVGDHVTLKEDVEADKLYGGLRLLSGAMYDNAKNQRMTVVRVDWSDDSNTYYCECKGNSQFTFHYSEEMLDKWDESKIHEGDTVKVVNTGLNYSSYPQWVGEHISDPYMAARYCYGSPDTDRKYKVIKIAEHESNGRTLAYIEECDGFIHNRCYLIEVKGLEKV